MTLWIANKTELGWLIDPIEKNNYVFRADGSIETIRGFDGKLKGEKPVEGFQLDLSPLI